MIISNVSRNILAGMAFTLLPLAAAQAGSIKTPIIFKGNSDQLICIANNVHTAAVTVIVRIVGITNPTDATQTCTLPVGDKEGCTAFLNNARGHCVITITGATNADVAARVRGVLFSRRITAPFATDALVQAQ